MPARVLLYLSAAALLCTAGTARADSPLWSPGLAPSHVAKDGALREEWGTLTLRLRQPQDTRPARQHYKALPAPTAVTIKSAGPIKLTETAYRAPVWPRGVDVLEAEVANSSDKAEDVVLEVSLPEKVSLGERQCVADGRPVLALPKGIEPVRRERPWGNTGGAKAMRNWGKPQGECDPAFRHILAGMGAVPIVYRFRVEPGAACTVVLGLCEGHWAMAGQRPLQIRVEGAPKRDIDPVATWGHRKPGCLRFDAKDANKDGRIEVAVEPHPEAPDRNPILNVIWVFSPATRLDMREVLRGKMSSVAEYYVDVGGEKDQLLYESDPLTYKLKLGAGQTQRLCFLLASPGGAAVPDPDKMTWTPETLRKAAEDVWADADEEPNPAEVSAKGL